MIIDSKIRRALITGINGQDGYFLTYYLLENNFQVYGIVNKNSSDKSKLSDLLKNNKIVIFTADICNKKSIFEITHLFE